jgi:hypothetical protein
VRQKEKLAQTTVYQSRFPPHSPGPGIRHGYFSEIESSSPQSGDVIKRSYGSAVKHTEKTFQLINFQTSRGFSLLFCLAKKDYPVGVSAGFHVLNAPDISGLSELLRIDQYAITLETCAIPQRHDMFI